MHDIDLHASFAKTNQYSITGKQYFKNQRSHNWQIK
jgi:hypothetical protein